MNHIEAIISLIPNEPNSNIGFYTDDSELISAVENGTDEIGGTAYDFKKQNLKRLPFGGEFFEFIVFQNDEKVLDKTVAKQLEKAIQKNRTLAILTSSLTADELDAVYTDLNFTHIEPIELGEYKVFTMRKWFRL